MSRKVNLFLSALIVCQISIAQHSEKPKLVVGVIVDQMRQEYLYRFADHYGDGGFKKLLKDGFELKNGHFNYVPTKTGPGHASVYTGTTPRVHGVIGNEWYDKNKKGEIYCVQDDDVSGVGGAPGTGKMSPKNLLVTTITDELMLFYQNRSKVVGVSMKDRGSVLPAGHQATGSYWYDTKTGRFITSTYYMSSLKQWTVEFNKRNLPLTYMKNDWKPLKALSEYVESARDKRPYEEDIFEGLGKSFPYDFKKMTKEKKLDKIFYTPYGNTLTTEIALAAIDGEQIGQDDVPDFLAISYSSTDKIGHAFGPYSKEVQDTYIRLDLEFERLINELNKKVGVGQWTMFITSDHGIADIPAYLAEEGHLTSYTSPNNKSLVLEALKSKFGSDNLIEHVGNNQIFLNKETLKELGVAKSEVVDFLVGLLIELDGVSSAFSADAVNNYSGSNYDIRLLAAGYNAKRSGDILYTIPAGWLSSWNKENGGTNHHSHFTYDTHVPILFYGKGIKAGSTVKYHSVTDIAPTLSMMLNIKLPSGATGQPIEELWED